MIDEVLTFLNICAVIILAILGNNRLRTQSKLAKAIEIRTDEASIDKFKNKILKIPKIERIFFWIIGVIFILIFTIKIIEFNILFLKYNLETDETFFNKINDIINFTNILFFLGLAILSNHRIKFDLEMKNAVRSGASQDEIKLIQDKIDKNPGHEGKYLLIIIFVFMLLFILKIIQYLINSF